MTDPRKDLPPASASNFSEKLRETVQTYLGNRGDKLDRGVTLRDLVDSGLVKLGAGYLAGGSGRPISGPGPGLVVDDGPPDLTPPPTPTGFSASAAFVNIFLTHDAPLYTQGKGHDRTVVYGATWTTGDKPTFDKAVELTTFQGTIFAYPTNPATTWHLWIKWKSKDGVLSSDPAGGTNGVVTTTGQDVDLLVKALTGPGKPFTVLAVDTVIDGVSFPAGTYSTRAFIIDAQITNAKIKNLAVDDAKIASLSVSKLVAGTVTAGDIVSSKTTVVGGVAVPSWSVNGSTGLATFNNAIVRGTVYANAGEFRGIDIKDANGNVILSAGSPLKNQISANLPDGLKGNLLDLSSWLVYTHDSVLGFNRNGGVYEQYRRSTALPDGSVGCAWFCYPGLYVNNAYGFDGPLPLGQPAGDADGGWNTDPVKIDSNRPYRFSVWVRREGGATGITYLGCAPGSVRAMGGGAVDVNPYFFYTGLASLVVGRWYLMVGYVYPASEGGQPVRQFGGLFDGTTGQKVAAGNDFCWAPGAVESIHRAYLFYSAAGSHIDLVWPRMEVADGREPSLAALLAGGNVSARNRIDALNITTFINPGAIGNTQIGGDIYSSNWIATNGSQGWYLQRNGNFYCRNGNFSGSLYGADIAGVTGTFYGPVVASSFAVPGGRFAAYSDGTVIADNVDIRRRIVLQNGVLDATTIVYGSSSVADGNGGFYTVFAPPGTTFTGTVSMPALTDIYDANAASSSNNQPYYVAASGTSTFREYNGTNGSTFSVQIFGSPTINRAYSNAGIFTDDFRVALQFTYAITLLAGSFTSFRLPTIQWTLFKL